MALGLTQPLRELSTNIIPWVIEAAGAYGKQSGSLKLLEASGAVQACNGTALPLFCMSLYDEVRSSLLPDCNFNIGFVACQGCFNNFTSCNINVCFEQILKLKRDVNLLLCLSSLDIRQNIALLEGSHGTPGS